MKYGVKFENLRIIDPTQTGGQTGVHSAFPLVLNPYPDAVLEAMEEGGYLTREPIMDMGHTTNGNPPDGDGWVLQLDSMDGTKYWARQVGYRLTSKAFMGNDE